jgi:hypothetical protein
MDLVVMIRTYHDILSRDNEMSAYLLGFWMADGNIFLSSSKERKRKQKGFSIINTDHQTMLMIGRWFGKEPKSHAGARKGYKTFYTIKVKSDRLFDTCYGLTRSTSKSNQSVPLPELRRDLHHHFVRGFFDGDGSIHVKTYKNRHGKFTSALQTSFTAGLKTGDFLERLRDLIRSHIPVNPKKAVVSSGTNRKLVFNQYDSMLLCNWLYSGATFFMERKKHTWDAIDKTRLTGSRKFATKSVIVTIADRVPTGSGSRPWH